MKKSLHVLSLLVVPILLGVAGGYLAVGGPSDQVSLVHLSMFLALLAGGFLLTLPFTLRSLLKNERLMMGLTQSSLTSVVSALVILLSTSPSAVATALAAPSISADGVSFGWLTPFIPLILAGVSSLSLGLLALLSLYLRQKTQLVKSERLQTALRIVEELIFKKVRELMDQSIKHLKAASADGKLTPDEARQAAVTAVKEVWASLPEAIQNILVNAAGSEEAAQDAYLHLNVENAVDNVRAYSSSSNSAYSVGSQAPQEVIHNYVPRVDRETLAQARARIGLVHK